MASTGYMSGASAFFEEARSHRYLSDDEVEALGTARAVEDLIRHHMFMVIQAAYRYHCLYLDFEECLADGMIGLWRAAEIYDPKQGLFHMLARKCIRNEIFNGITVAKNAQKRMVRDFDCKNTSCLSLHDLKIMYYSPEISSVSGLVKLQAEEHLPLVALHIQKVIDYIYENYLPRKLSSFLFCYEVKEEQQEEVASFWQRQGYARRSDYYHDAKRIWKTLKRYGIHTSGENGFEYEVWSLHALERIVGVKAVLDYHNAA